jgi:hypothetical protein
MGSNILTGGTGSSTGGTTTGAGGSNIVVGSTQASSGGTSASGGSSGVSSGTSTLDCHFTYTNKGSSKISDCHVSGNTQHACDDAATCICSDPSHGSSCYAFYVTPHGSASLNDFCAHTATAAYIRSLSDALTLMAASENATVTTSTDCSQIRAIL